MFRSAPGRGLALAAIAPLLLTGSVLALGDDAPNPLKELKESVRQLAKRAKSDGYSASVSIRGGTSVKADHHLRDVSISQDYQGDILGAVMHVPAMHVFRKADKGALFDGERWSMLQARKEGKELDRLFMFPLQVLSTALGKASDAEWLESTAPAPDPVVTEEKQGRTSVARKQTQDQVYHRMRLHLPNEVAVQVFTEVQNSGCLEGG
ncbi:MAG: hypothetical protein ACYTGJ_06125 [Planctomycetota bacterium]|jgi:hypothetical protein